MAARQLRHLPVKTGIAASALAGAVAASLAAAPAFAQHPGRHLESRRASAPFVYLAKVAEVREAGPADAATGTAARMEATLTPVRIYRPQPPPSPPASVVVRYEQAGKPTDEAPAPVAYTLAAGDHVLVFASSFDTGFPLEMAAGNPKALAAQVTAFRDHLARMDASQAALHGATPAVKAQQTALYGRILADLGGPRLP